MSTHPPAAMRADPPPNAAPDTATVLRGLDEATAALPTCEVLDAVSWDGPLVDPDTTTAAEFLSWL